MRENQLAVIYGTSSGSMVRRLLERLAPQKDLPLSTKIALKPNLVLAKPSSSGATTTPGVTAGVIEFFQERGYKNICILESSWLGDDTGRAFKVCGYEELSHLYNIPLYDLKRDAAVKKTYRGLSLEVSKRALEVDYLVNLPVLKAHCQTRITCALKNLKGCIPDREKKRFHSLGLHKPIAYLNKLLPSGLVVVDGLMGDLSYEEGGNPVEMGRIIGGYDPVLIDSYGAYLLGYNPLEIEYIEIAHRMGLGNLYSPETTLNELDRGKKPRHAFKPGKLVDRLAKFIKEDHACSPCYGSLIHALHRLEEKGGTAGIGGPFYIGRGFTGKEHPGTGIGSCTSRMSRSLPGCPPSACEIIDFIRKISH